MIVDLTGVACSAIAAFFGLLSATVPAVINARMRDTKAASVLGEAVRNSLGVMQQQSTLAAQVLSPRIAIPGVPDALQPGVQYVLDQAGPEAQRLGVGPEKIASKILAQVGLAQIATNTAVAASSAPLVPDPLGPVPVGASGVVTTAI